MAVDTDGAAAVTADLLTGRDSADAAGCCWEAMSTKQRQRHKQTARAQASASNLPRPQPCLQLYRLHRSTTKLPLDDPPAWLLPLELAVVTALFVYHIWRVRFERVEPTRTLARHDLFAENDDTNAN